MFLLLKLHQLANVTGADGLLIQVVAPLADKVSKLEEDLVREVALDKDHVSDLRVSQLHATVQHQNIHPSVLGVNVVLAVGWEFKLELLVVIAEVRTR